MSVFELRPTSLTMTNEEAGSTNKRFLPVNSPSLLRKLSLQPNKKTHKSDTVKTQHTPAEQTIKFIILFFNCLFHCGYSSKMSDSRDDGTFTPKRNRLESKDSFKCEKPRRLSEYQTNYEDKLRRFRNTDLVKFQCVFGPNLGD